MSWAAFAGTLGAGAFVGAVVASVFWLSVLSREADEQAADR